MDAYNINRKKVGYAKSAFHSALELPQGNATAGEGKGRKDSHSSSLFQRAASVALKVAQHLRVARR